MIYSFRFLLFMMLLLNANAAFTTNANPISTVLNYQEINPNLVSGGQISYEQIATLPESGIDLVINLTKNPSDVMAREGYEITQLGIDYVHIPVAWSAPTRADYQLFEQILKSAKNQKVLVHCDANYRASAFIYLFQRLALKVPANEAQNTLETIWPASAWQEYPQWQSFINDRLIEADLSQIFKPT